MRTRFLFLLFLTASACSFSQTYTKISSAEITFNFLNNDVDGSISGFKSNSKIDLNNLSTSTFGGSVEVETIKTGNFIRDWSLKGGKYFDADAHPKITFKSTEVTPTNAGLNVKGILTIKGTAKPITIDFTKKENKLMGATTLFASDYGINVKKKPEQNKVSVRLDFELE